MNREADWYYNTKEDEFELILSENGQVVNRRTYKQLELAEQAKQSWLQGSGPKFLAD